MKTLNLQQGTNAWHEARAKYRTASEAPAMMGLSKYKSRSDLVKEKATGITPEITPQKQALFDRGHASEAASRPFPWTWAGLKIPFPRPLCLLMSPMPPQRRLHPSLCPCRGL